MKSISQYNEGFVNFKDFCKGAVCQGIDEYIKCERHVR